MEKKYKIVLLGDDLPKKVLFKSNVKRNIQQKFKKLGKSTKPLFTRKYVKRKNLSISPRFIFFRTH